MSKTNYSVYEQNFAHFKFLSQHFHKSLTILTDRPEIKGIKAHDRFAKLFGWDSLNEVNQYLRGYDKRLHDFGEIKEARIQSVYSDLFPEIDMFNLLGIYYDFYEFSHYSDRHSHLSFETLKHLQSITFWPKRPSWDMGQVADFFAVALERFSSTSKSDTGLINREMLNSAMMLFFDFYDKGLITDFRWQDIADLTNPHNYHDSFIKYKSELKPKFEFQSSAAHCYEKVAYYMDYNKQIAAHDQLCSFIYKLTGTIINSSVDKEKTLFNKVYQRALMDGLTTVDSPNSIEVNKDRVFTLEDFDLSRAKFVDSKSKPKD